MRDDNRGVYRSIYCSIWDDPEFQTFSPHAQLVFFNLRTCKDTNFPCIFTLYRSSLEERMPNMTTADITTGWQELLDAGWIRYERPILWIVKGLRNEPNYAPNNIKHRIGIENILKGLPKLEIVNQFRRDYGFDTPSPGNKEGIGTESIQRKGKREGKGKREEKGNSASPSDLQEAWNRICISLPKCTTLTEKRKQKAKARLSEHVIEQMEYVFRKVEGSSFCRGENDRGWRADFDWITANPENALKVIEGKYDTNKPGEKPKRCHKEGCTSTKLMETSNILHCREHDPIFGKEVGQ